MATVEIEEHQIESGELPEALTYVLPELRKNKRFWRIEVVDDCLVTTSGAVGTIKPVTRKRQVKLNQSGRDMRAQCWLEAKQWYKKTRQGGYVSVNGSDTVVESTRDQLDQVAIGQVHEEEEADCDRYEPAVIEYQIRHPMLAGQYEKRLKVKKGLTWPLRAQVKRDGIRGMLIWEGNAVSIYSRTLHHLNFMNHIRLAAESILRDRPGLVLDGELYCHGKGFQQITSITVQKTVPHPEEAVICLYVFDCYDLSRPEMKYSDRRTLLESLLMTERASSGPIRLVEEDLVRDETELMTVHERNRESGYEGTMLRLDSPYSHRRCNDLLKYKFYQEMDTTIVGIEATDGGDVNLILEMDNCTRFPQRPTGTAEEKQSWLDDPTLVIDRVYCFNYVGVTDTGIPKAIRDGRIRFDLDYH